MRLATSGKSITAGFGIDWKIRLTHPSKTKCRGGARGQCLPRRACEERCNSGGRSQIRRLDLIPRNEVGSLGKLVRTDRLERSPQPSERKWLQETQPTSISSRNAKPLMRPFSMRYSANRVTLVLFASIISRARSRAAVRILRLSSSEISPRTSIILA